MTPSPDLDAAIPEALDGLTVERFIEHFREHSGWACEPDTRITKELTAFAAERLGSTRDLDELHTIFCITHGIKPFAAGGAK